MTMKLNDSEHIYFTADLHLGHANIMKYTKRPWANLEEMHAAILKAWNEKVPTDGIVFILGDVWFKGKSTSPEYLRQLNGVKHLVRGNHDHRMDSGMSHCFNTVTPYLEVQVEAGPFIVLCHYPFAAWNHRHHGAYNLHGHEHGSYDERNRLMRRLDVGIDAEAAEGTYAPISFAKVKELLEPRALIKHHEE